MPSTFKFIILLIVETGGNGSPTSDLINSDLEEIINIAFEHSPLLNPGISEAILDCPESS